MQYRERQDRRKGKVPVQDIGEQERESNGFEDARDEAGRSEGIFREVEDDIVEEFCGERVHFCSVSSC